MKKIIIKILTASVIAAVGFLLFAALMAYLIAGGVASGLKIQI